MTGADKSLDPDVIAILTAAERLWVVGAIHGGAAAVAALHRELQPRLLLHDRLVYTGNYLGRGRADGIAATMNELVRFRRRFIGRPGIEAADVVYLRGAQEEMWSKLLQLQLASDPRSILTWMAAHGVGPTLEAYGSSIRDGEAHIREGTMGLTRWTGNLRKAMQAKGGHFDLFKSLKRAARTDGGELLVVHAGIDPTRPLLLQGDAFWWDTGNFKSLAEPYEGFTKVIRGYDHRTHTPVLDNPLSACVDGGCGSGTTLLGGTLRAVCFDLTGRAVDEVAVTETGETVKRSHKK